MNAETKLEHPRDPTPEEFAEAAAWVARLHGPERTLQVEFGFRRWLRGSESRAVAFEAMTAAWEVTGRLEPAPFQRLSRWQRAGYRDGFFKSALAVAGLAALAIAGIFYYTRVAGISTGVGEQRLLTLEDGSRVLLNTTTRVRVKYDEQTRRIELKSGEALFDVSKAPDRPFIVEVAGREVKALGTSFVVREDDTRMSVTLIDGKVAVTRREAGREVSLLPKEEVLLTPGERLTLTADRAPRLDRPQIEKVTAWRRGQLDFENTPLATAADEMNRYSIEQISVDKAQAESIAITGVFRAGDARSFAAAVARAYNLTISQESEEIRLASPQQKDPQ